MRINKLLSNYGVCSRKEANRIIEDKRVVVNGELAFPGQWVEESDDIWLDGEKLRPKKKIYIALNKPVGITCTTEHKVKGNIVDFVNHDKRIFPIGRLDYDTTGVLLLTNDGEFANILMHPKYNIEKVELLPYHTLGNAV